jgi:hypothetical protein
MHHLLVGIFFLILYLLMMDMYVLHCVAGSVEKQICYAVNAELSTLSTLTAHLDSLLPPISRLNFNINKEAIKNDVTDGIVALPDKILWKETRFNSLPSGDTSSISASSSSSSLSPTTALSSTSSSLSSNLKDYGTTAMFLGTTASSDENTQAHESVSSDAVYLTTTLTLRRLVIYTYDVIKRLQLLDYVVSEILRERLHGCTLLSFLHKCLLRFENLTFLFT